MNGERGSSKGLEATGSMRPQRRRQPPPRLSRLVRHEPSSCRSVRSCGGLLRRGESTDTVHYGRCLVSIPKSHRFGSVGSAWWKRWLTWTDDRLRVVERAEMARDAFWKALRRELAQGQPDEQQALVYLHGYNVSFDEAAIRSPDRLRPEGPWRDGVLQLAVARLLGGYAADEASIEASEAAITDFLIRLATESGASRVHVIAHSMGNRGLLRAIQRIIAQASATAGVRFGQVFLAAPDLASGSLAALSSVSPAHPTHPGLVTRRPHRSGIPAPA